MEWSGREAFVNKEMEDWVVDINEERKKSGRMKSARGLTFLIVDKAGHMASSVLIEHFGRAKFDNRYPMTNR